MSDGMSDMHAMDRLGKRLGAATHEFRDAIKDAEDGHRGMSIDVQAEVNEILLPTGWKLVRAEKFTGYR